MRPMTTSRGLRDDGHCLSVADSNPTSSRPVAAVTLPSARPRVDTANRGDHAAIQQLLYEAAPRLSAAEFQQQVEESSYQPEQRLLIRRGPQVAGHVRCVLRRMHFGASELTILILSDLVTITDPLADQWRRALLAAAEKRARGYGAVLVAIHTPHWQWFLQQGWTVGPRHTFSEIGPRQFLSHEAGEHPLENSPLSSLLDPTPGRHYHVQLWRRIELQALQTLYATFAATAYGAWLRRDGEWQELIERGRFERIYVVRESNSPQADDSTGTIVGYAATAGQRVMECLVSADHPAARNALLQRICHEALERDWHPVRVDASPADPLHMLLRNAGGHVYHHDLDSGRALLARVVDEAAFVAALHREWLARAGASSLAVPLNLPLTIAGQHRCRLLIGAQAAQLISDPSSRSGLNLSRSDFWQALLGRTSASELIESGRLQASSRRYAQIARQLLPRLPLWIPGWEQI